MEIFYRETAFHAGEKNQENDFAPSEKFSFYAPDRNKRSAFRGQECHLPWTLAKSVTVLRHRNKFLFTGDRSVIYHEH